MAKKIKAQVTEKVGHYRLGDTRYSPGDVVEVSEHLFKRGCACGHLRPVPKPEPKIVEKVEEEEKEEGEDSTSKEDTAEPTEKEKAGDSKSSKTKRWST